MTTKYQNVLVLDFSFFPGNESKAKRFSFHLKEKEFSIELSQWVFLHEWDYKKKSNYLIACMGTRCCIDFRRANWCSTTQCQKKQNNNKNILTRLSQTHKREWLHRDSPASLESSTFSGLGRFFPLLTLVCPDTEDAVPSHQEGPKKVDVLSASSCLHQWTVYSRSNP